MTMPTGGWLLGRKRNDNDGDMMLFARPHCNSLRMFGRITTSSRRLNAVFGGRRCLSMTRVEIDDRAKVATLTLQRPPVNSLNLELLQEISDTIKSVEAHNENTIQALVLASSNPKVFCAGLDLTELYQPTRLEAFWEAFQQVYLDLYGSRLATIASMSGHAPAAGCVLGLCCDYRFLGSTASIGLNETKFGLAIAPWIGGMMVDTVGVRRAELAMGLGMMFDADDALELGLVDEVVDDKWDDTFDLAQSEAVKWAEIPPQARFAAKMLTRHEPLERLNSRRKEDTKAFVDFCMRDDVQDALGLYLASLSKK